MICELFRFVYLFLLGGSDYYWEALNLLWAVDSARDKILNDNPVLKVGYELRDSLVNETVVADVTALESLK